MITSILKEHGISSVELSNGVIIASEKNVITNETVYTNVTKMTIKKLYQWLGY